MIHIIEGGFEQQMKEILRKAMTTEGYQDLRYEDVTTTTIQFTGRELKEVSVARKSGGHARALVDGGWGSYSFTTPDAAKATIEKCIGAARLVGRRSKSPVVLAKAPVVEDVIRVTPKVDPRQIPLDQKKALTEEYNSLVLANPAVQTTVTTYTEIAARKFFANNEGTYIDQEQLLAVLTIRIMTKEGNLVQRVSVALGGSPDYSLLEGHQALVEEKTRQAAALLKAEPVKAGRYTVILDPGAAGVFIHEAFGHLSEADGLADNPKLQKTMTLGSEFGLPILNVIDDPSWEGHPGSYVYDEEGVRGARTYLIREGKLVGRLHSRETAGKLGEEVTGNARAKDYSFAPVVRMSNIFIDKGETPFDEMVASVDNGLYLVGAAGGQTSGEAFTFGTQLGYKIEKGKITGMVRDAVLSGNLFETLRNIVAVGNDLEMNRSGGCGKAGQILVGSGHGAPHIKILDMTIGGK